MAVGPSDPQSLRQGGREGISSAEESCSDHRLGATQRALRRIGRDAYLDVFFPSEIESLETLPTIVWVHGGGWVSGSKDQIANYLRILAGKGFTVVGVGYSIAPGKTYPPPIRQVNAALTYLTRNAEQLHVDPKSLVLAGDSGGAHIASQLANALSVPAALNGVPVHSLFFPANFAPPLPHEYQFNLDTDSGRLALQRSVRFLRWAVENQAP